MPPAPKLLDKQQIIIDALVLGATRAAAAAKAGIHRDTFYDWFAKGKKARSGMYRLFSDAVEVAEGEAEYLKTSQITIAATKDWHAAAWWLERRRRQEWGPPPRESIHMEGQLQSNPEQGDMVFTFEVDTGGTSPADNIAAAQAAAAARGEDDGPGPQAAP